MKSSLSPNTGNIAERVKKFYDFGSPYYQEFFGPHIHDGYYLTGRESAAEAQENLIRFLVDQAQIQPGSKILDVGCGIGGSSIWLAKNLAAKTTGITISPVQIEMANRMAQKQKVDSAFLLMNAEEMDFQEPFEVVWLVAALTHFRNQEQFFSRAARYLVPDGKFVIFDWTLNENIPDPQKDRDVRLLIEGLVLSNFYTNSIYLSWLMEAGYRINFTEDITARTLKTWDDALSLMKEPSMWEMALNLARKEGRDALRFLRALSVMRRAVRNGKIKSSVIIAQKI